MKNICKTLSMENNDRGQALITLLFFVVIAIAVISSATLVVSASILSSSNSELGLMSYYLAESGVEDGVLYAVRNPSYSGTLPTVFEGVGQISVTINSGSIISTGTYGASSRKIQVNTAFTNGVLNISSWREIN